MSASNEAGKRANANRPLTRSLDSTKEGLVPNDTCILDLCQRSRCGSHGYCEPHYRRWKSTGDPVKPCSTCGTDMTGMGTRSKFCSPPCRQCSVDGCDGGVASGGLCQLHSNRKQKRGTLAPKCCPGCGMELSDYRREYCSEDCKPRCKVEGCERPHRPLDGYCARHKANVRASGKPVGKHEWEIKSDTYSCLTCGTEFQAWGSRKFCSHRCAGLFRTYGNSIPSLNFCCAECGTIVERNRFEKLKQRGDKKLCDHCRGRGSKRHRTSPRALANRDGTKCGICGGDVDMGLAYPDPMSGSVDHVIPVAHGGGHEKDNLQLAHLRCNVRKQARMDYEPEIMA